MPRPELAAGCLAIQCSLLEGREQGDFCLFVLFLFTFIYLFTYFRHSNFEQILSSEMGMALGQTRSTRRNLTLTGVHSPSLFSGIFDEPGIMHHTPNFVRISLRLREEY